MQNITNLLILLSLILFKSNANENEYIDLTSCIDARTQQYLITPYDKIFVCSPYRTGSTYVFNILRFLFEDDKTKNSPNWSGGPSGRIVCKFHSLDQQLNTKITYVVTVRNPLYACFSNYRVHLDINEIESCPDEELQKLVDEWMNFWYRIGSIDFSRSDLILLRYEQFLNNVDYVVSEVESFYSIRIREEDRVTLRKAMSRENVIKNTEKYQFFSKFDPGSLIHGNHIQQEEMEKNEYERVMRVIINQLKNHKEIISKWGYSYIFCDQRNSDYEALVWMQPPNVSLSPSGRKERSVETYLSLKKVS